ncbi:MAG: iron-sulfur cluster assembly scaffold protein [Candidatus Gribaldobacteria bacterium]|nr:iron-sulfur cluster assembly scaffold protein [Candidatus Gribaldobacteria bacterium]
MAFSYSKEVLKHFNKPHNYGKMKNPDGIGQVGNMVCLEDSTILHSEVGMKEIKDFKVGDTVLSHDGLYHTVKRVVREYCSNGLIEIQGKLGKNLVTEDHLVFALKLPNERKFAYFINKKRIFNQLSWHHAGNLEKGDLLAYPTPNFIKDINDVKFTFKKSYYDFKSINIPSIIPINKDFLRLAGYYLSEGYIGDIVSNMQVGFSFNSNEEHYIKDVARIVKNIFGLEAKFARRPKKNVSYIYFNSIFLVQIFKEYFGKGAKNKKIPDFMLWLPVEKQKELIKGLWRGDGYINLVKKGARAEFVSISVNLINQLKILLLRQSIVPSIYCEQEKIDSKGVKHQKAFRIHIGEIEYLKRMSSILGENFDIPAKRVNIHSWVDGQYAFFPITKVNKINYAGKVFNLEVDKSSSFISDSLCLHNCGDVMKLYIKVGQNKQKQEIIKDIKFETYGCLSAIASSSMLTDLIKGKTIDEALDFNRKEIVKELGGLPPIKIHCSVLAGDALVEAIHDYLVKQKRPLPEKLKLRHQQLVQEKQDIQKEYHQKN